MAGSFILKEEEAVKSRYPSQTKELASNHRRINILAR